MSDQTSAGVETSASNAMDSKPAAPRKKATTGKTAAKKTPAKTTAKAPADGRKAASKSGASTAGKAEGAKAPAAKKTTSKTGPAEKSAKATTSSKPSSKKAPSKTKAEGAPQEIAGQPAEDTGASASSQAGSTRKTAGTASKATAGKPKAAPKAAAKSVPQQTDGAENEIADKAPAEKKAVASAKPSSRRGASAKTAAKQTAKSAVKTTGEPGQDTVETPAAVGVQAIPADGGERSAFSQASDDPKEAKKPAAGRGRGGKPRNARDERSETEAKDVMPSAEDAPSIPVAVSVSGEAGSAEPSQAESQAAEDAQEGQKSGRRRSRRSRGRGRKNGQTAQAVDGAPQNVAETDDGQAVQEDHSSRQKESRESRSASDAKPEAPQEGKQGRRKMFVSVQPDEQVEVVICEEGQVQEYYVEMLQQAKTKGNIYKAVIHNVDPNLQAAFINYGAVKNGFLQIDEVHPEYYNTPHDPGKSRKYPPIQKVLKPGQELLVQIVKEPTGNKGAFLTTYLSLPGRFLVLTPGREQIGVSRKVDNDEERARLREMLAGLNPGPGLGVIVRTVSMGTSKTNLQKDLQSLKKVWKEVRERGTTEQSPCQIYQEMDLTTRAIRDYLTDQVGEVWIDDEKTAQSITEVAGLLFPKKKNLVRAHKDEGTGLFERFNVQRQLDQIHSREVALPSGGRLVIDPTEALTAIDINSGRSGGKNNFEDMAYRTNMEAARMIPLQLRLRDIGGQIVADFIEMRDKSHWREVEKTLRQGMKVDRARYDVGKIGPFGMLEIVRQRLGSSAISVSTEVCPHCKGTGVRRNMEWQSQQVFKDIQRQMRAAQAQKKTELPYEVDYDLAFHLLNQKRQRICELEQATGVTLLVQPKS